MAKADWRTIPWFKSDGLQCPEECDQAPVIIESCRGCEFFVEEDKTMSKETNTKKNANANESKKGEKKMKDRRVQKYINEDGNTFLEAVEPSIEDQFDFEAMLDADVEAIEAETGEEYSEGKTQAVFFAIQERLGLNAKVPIKSIEWVTDRIEGKEAEAEDEEDTDPEFVRSLKVTLMDESIQPIYIRKRMALCKNGVMLKSVKVFDERTYAGGKKGHFWTVRPKALGKKVEELNGSDYKIHDIGKMNATEGGYKIFASTKKEITAIEEQLGISNLKSKNGVFPIPEGTLLDIYVYQDVVIQEVEEEEIDQETGDVLSTTKKTVPNEYYKASFAAPKDHLIKEESTGKFLPKYNEAFTTSDDLAYMNENKNMPGVEAYHKNNVQSK